MWAASGGHVDVVRYLVAECGADELPCCSRSRVSPSASTLSLLSGASSCLLWPPLPSLVALLHRLPPALAVEEIIAN
jgi:hypothetical protein